MPMPSPLHRFAPVLVLTSLLLGGCPFLENVENEPPTVSLAVAPTSARPGATLVLVAAASDDTGIAQVEFFRIESDDSLTRLATDSEAPFRIDTTVGGDVAVGTVLRFKARATDDDGDSTDSATVEVNVIGD
jgi:hypothetical protein